MGALILDKMDMCRQSPATTLVEPLAPHAELADADAFQPGFQYIDDRQANMANLVHMLQRDDQTSHRLEVRFILERTTGNSFDTFRSM
jgi:hypothetical protein